MLEFHKFKKKYLESLYSINKIDDSLISTDYDKFISGVKEAEDMAFSILRKEGFGFDTNPLAEILDDDYAIDEYNGVLLTSLLAYLEDVYGNERIDGSGMCLKSNLIGRACQMIYNEDLLGVVRDYDNDNPKILIVDFGDEEEVRVNIDELIIAGQKNS